MRSISGQAQNWKCRHCGVLFHSQFFFSTFAGDDCGEWRLEYINCPSCKQLNIHVITRKEPNNVCLRLVWPRTTGRPPCPVEVPSHLTKDYTQACLVLHDSPEASAALSRRCLQGILRDKGYAQKDLAPQIQAALDSNTLPSHITAVLDAVRNIGNFAAHPMKSQSTGEIIDVEPGEAEWNLDVLETLFDFYFVQVAANQKRIAALNARLADVGKPPIKT